MRRILSFAQIVVKVSKIQLPTLLTLRNVMLIKKNVICVLERPSRIYVNMCIGSIIKKEI